MINSAGLSLCRLRKTLCIKKNSVNIDVDLRFRKVLMLNNLLLTLTGSVGRIDYSSRTKNLKVGGNDVGN